MLNNNHIFPQGAISGNTALLALPRQQVPIVFRVDQNPDLTEQNA